MSNSRLLPGPSTPAKQDLRWVGRYARHCQVKLDTSLPAANAIRGCFTPAAWRLLCRSDRSSFIPVLRNQQLCFDSLISYTQALVNTGFKVAPSAELLDYLIRASYLFFDRMPGVPEVRDEMILMRLATRHGAVSQEEFRLVHAWLPPEHGIVKTRMSWRTVLRKANAWQQRRQMLVEQARAHADSPVPASTWEFACGALHWRGYDIIPLTNAIDLWDEGQAMSSCLYKLRGLCLEISRPSRFFSVRKHGRRYATLELVCEESEVRAEEQATVGGHGHWRLQDCRLSHNRLPSEELIDAMIDFGLLYSDLDKRALEVLMCQPATS